METIRSLLRNVLRTLNGETWGAKPASTPGSVPSQDMPGVAEREKSLPPPHIGMGPG